MKFQIAGVQQRVSVRALSRGLALCAILLLAQRAFAQTNVVTQHYDTGRTGANTKETILTPGNVVFLATEADSIYAFDADNDTGANARLSGRSPCSMRLMVHLPARPPGVNGIRDPQYGSSRCRQFRELTQPTNRPTLRR